jgi:hypothetical protein
LNDASAQFFAIALAATWCGFGLYGVLRKIERSPQARELLERFRRARLSTKAAFVAGLIAVVAIGGTKPGDGNGGGLRGGPSAPEGPPPDPPFGIVEVRTNNVALRAESASAVEVTDWRKHGSSTGGVWLDFDEPFFRIGTNPVSRAYVAANGTISFESMRRPRVGFALPDAAARPEGSPHLEPALAPLLAPLGMVPEANWGEASRPGEPLRSRFWHDEAPGRGRVFTWENALLDRLPGRCVSVQAELLPSGDFTYRYDFADALDPPATNLVLGAQVGTNGVNALYFGPLPEGAPGGAGWGSLSAPVWRVDGVASPPGEPQSIADILCTNGVLRAPARFSIEWKNTSGLDPNADSDGDGLSDWDEIFRHGTDPNQSDTDGDGLSDSSEVLSGANPLDADENNDGVPDGADPAAWAADPIWADNATNTSTSITITLNTAVPANASASLVVEGLCIPLRSPGSWTLALAPGALYSYRLHTYGAAADLSIAPATNAPPQRSGPPLRSVPAPFPFWTDDPDGVFDGPSGGGAGEMAVPTLELEWIDPDDGSHEDNGSVALHEANAATFQYTVFPGAINRIPALIQTTGFNRSGNRLVLPVPSGGVVVTGTLAVNPSALRWGSLFEDRSAHRCSATFEHPYCDCCGHYMPVDLRLFVSQDLLTLKHDNQTTISIVHSDPHGSVVSSPSIQIRRLGETNWLELAASDSVDPWTARVAGYFELQGKLTVDGRDAYTPLVDVEVQFPSYFDLVGDSSVVGMTSTAWQGVLNDCTPTNRRERGYWILLNTETDHYFHTTTVFGPAVTNMQGAYVNLPQRPSDVPIAPSPLAAGATYPVATFHAHTPTTYLSVGRPVGPSPEDASANNDPLFMAPGIVRDYVESQPGSGAIPPQHPKSSPSMLYPTAGIQRRPTP